MPEDAVPEAHEWTECRCCGKSFPAVNMVPLQLHPGDALCITCVSRLSQYSRPIIRRLYPIWHVPARIRAARNRPTAAPHE